MSRAPSITTGGLSSSRAADIQRRIFDRFGPDAVKDLVGLEKAGLFLSQTLIQSLVRAGIKNPTYIKLDKGFNLMISPDDPNSPSQPSFQNLKRTFDTIKNYAEKKINDVINKSIENSNNNSSTSFDANKASQNSNEKF